MSTLRLNGATVTLNGVIVTLNGADGVAPPAGTPPATLIWPAVWPAPRVIAASVGPEVWPATVEDRVIPGTWRAD